MSKRPLSSNGGSSPPPKKRALESVDESPKKAEILSDRTFRLLQEGSLQFFKNLKAIKKQPESMTKVDQTNHILPNFCVHCHLVLERNGKNCGFCDRLACPNCIYICNGCLEKFCFLCTLATYDRRESQCFRCFNNDSR